MDLVALIGQTLPAAILAAALFAVMWPAWMKQSDRQAEAIERQAEEMRQLIINNTEALTKMVAVTNHLCESRMTHDDRVINIEQVVVRTSERTVRIEQKVDQLPDLLRGRQP